MDERNLVREDPSLARSRKCHANDVIRAFQLVKELRESGEQDLAREMDEIVTADVCQKDLTVVDRQHNLTGVVAGAWLCPI